MVPHLDAEITTVRAELARVDPKAGHFLQVAGVLLGAGLAVLAGTGDRLGPLALTAAAGTAVLVGAALVLLVLACRPRLDGGDFGFVAFADSDAYEILARYDDGDHQDVDELIALARARELCWLSRAVRAKYAAISRAVPLLLAGYVGAALTAAAAIGAW
ncbi:Pycsar system effector family protein [Salinispora cortesiana]|uniref:Pycsar system effector family protein n=1 Tax=Salinispora cortesiana TaxID=1305843 RepID=UPI0003F862AA|nr:Pycsar system effector family protein [Salinispora cortesiana]